MQLEENSRLLASLNQILDPVAIEPNPAAFEIDTLQPAAVVRPATAEEAAELLKFANSNNLKIAISGSGTRRNLGNPLQKLDLVLSTERLNVIFEYSAADLMVGVQAGMKLADLQTELAKNGQFLPVESPALARGATIGGAIATNSSGPLRLSYGPARDWLIGIKFALADGTLAKGGGRVVKNVAGFDMMKLFIGSLGTLGLIYEMNFKLMPIPTAQATLVAGFSSFEEAGQAALKTIERGAFPAALTVLDNRAALVCGLPALEATLLVEVRNTARAVERQVREVAEVCQEFGVKATPVQDRTTEQKLWEAVTNFGYRELPEKAFALKVSALPDQTAALLRGAHALALKREIELATIAHAGHGLSWLTGSYADETAAASFIIEIMKWAESRGGSVAVERAPLSLKQQLPDVWGTALSESELKLMRRLKNELDPQNILNPGRFVGKL